MDTYNTDRMVSAFLGNNAVTVAVGKRRAR